MGYSFWFKHHSFCLAIIMGRSSFIQLLAFSAVPFSTVDAVRFRYYGPNDVKRSEDASAKRHLDDPIIDPIIPDPVSSCEPVTVTVCDSSAISSAFASATSAFEASSSAVISSALASYTSELVLWHNLPPLSPNHLLLCRALLRYSPQFLHLPLPHQNFPSPLKPPATFPQRRPCPRKKRQQASRLSHLTNLL